VLVLAVAFRDEPDESARFEDGLGDLGSVDDLCPRVLGVVQDNLVEVLAGFDESVVAPFVELRELELERPPRAVHAQATNLLPCAQLVAEAHLIEDLDGARCETVSTCLLARERLLLAHEDGVPFAREVVRGSGAGWPAADDGDVELGGHTISLLPPYGGRPALVKVFTSA
jgi:hypothetical protein